MDRGVKTKTPTIVMTRDTEMKFDESNPLLIRTIDEAQVKAVNIAKIMLIIMLLKYIDPANFYLDFSLHVFR